MQFFEQHFNSHHLLHAPHKWFLALLCSPIHYGEKHYQKYYHLRFSHAKKLFVFDLSLLASIFVLIGVTLFWFLYNPGINDLVRLNITPSKERIKSGEYITYTINYQNKSEVKLIEPKLMVTFPDGFVAENNTTSFTLNDLPENHSGSIQISGWSYGEPDVEERIIAELIYRQKDRKTLETKLTSLLQTHRDSVLEIKTSELETILNQGEKTLQITLLNTSEKPLPEVILPLQIGSGLELNITNPGQGIIENKTWKIASLLPNNPIILEAKLKSFLSPNTSNTELKIVPIVKVNQNNINQKSLSKILKVIHPKLTLETNWIEAKPYLNPGDTANLKLLINNNGNIDLQNLSVEIPIQTNLIEATRLANLNHGVYKNQTFTINKNFSANLNALTAGQAIELNLIIPVAYSPSGAEDLNLKLNPKVNATIKNSENSFQTTSETTGIKIATTLKMNAEIRYYTAEGDQLGRGPIPPEVGKETKYWALVNIKNGSSQVNSATFSATLPDYVTWTNKNSVSIGEGVKYNANDHTLTWYLRYLPAFEEAVINFEMALTPSEAQRGTTPILLKNITLVGKDAYTEADITKSLGNLDASLPNDTIGKEKGVLVQ